MKNFTIPNPCNENFNLMTPTERGAFCNQCATDTFNFENKNLDEIKSILRAHVGQHICGRITKEQEEALNRDFEQWSFKSVKSFQSAFLFTLIAVFGLGLFSCADQNQEQDIINFQQTAKAIMADAQKAAANVEIPKEEVVEAPELKKLLPLEEVHPTELVELIDYAQYRDINLIEEVLIEDHYRVYGGAMVMSYDFVDYLIEVEPVATEYDEFGREIPREFSSLAYPNPTADNSTIQIKVPTEGEFQIDLYDMNGKLQRTVYSGKIERGTFEQQIEMSDLPPGMYIATILSSNYKETVRISKI